MITRKEQSWLPRFLALGFGIVYLWFGLLKFFPGVSPAEQLAMDTLETMFFHLIPCSISVIILAIWETGLGLLFIFGVRHKWVIYLMLVHMVLTFSPFILFPDQCLAAPFVFTLTGQYIVKNIVFIGAGLLLLEYWRLLDQLARPGSSVSDSNH